MCKSVPVSVLFIFLLYSCGRSRQQLHEEVRQLWAKGEHEKAFPLLKKSAERGNEEDQFILGKCYKYGEVVKQNDSLAHAWIKKSAINGYAEAQLEMSMINFSDKEESYKWLSQCAAQSYPLCLQGLITYFEREKNKDSTIFYTQRLALLDSSYQIELFGSQIAHARIKLAMFYSDGSLVPKDLLLAYSWLLIYNECKRKTFYDFQKESIEKIKEIESELSVVEKREAIPQAENILKRKLRYHEDLHTINF